MNGIWQDLRFGARMLRKSPGFTTAAVLSLALGIGANTAIFQLLDAVRLKTLPVASPHELTEVRIIDMDKARGSFSGRHHAVTNSIWEQIRDRQQAFSGIFAWAPGGFNLAQGGEVRVGRALWVSGNFFGLLALLLASVGLYGILSYGVASRTNEIGIRMALGAQSRNVLSLILREAVLLVLIGVAVGLPVIYAATRFAATLLFELKPTDPLSLTLAGLLLFTVAMLAAYLPARRATKVDPLVALRYE